VARCDHWELPLPSNPQGIWVAVAPIDLVDDWVVHNYVRHLQAHHNCMASGYLWHRPKMLRILQFSIGHIECTVIPSTSCRWDLLVLIRNARTVHRTIIGPMSFLTLEDVDIAHSDIGDQIAVIGNLTTASLGHALRSCNHD
jgi:hypothetical protein